MRLSYDGELCTVRYEGPIPVWNVNAYGVEWDDASRGKHDGVLQGKRYFACVVENSGSFVKTTKQYDEPKSFSQALKEKYLDKFEYEEVKLSHVKAAQSVGMDKIHRRQANLEQLRLVSLGHCCVQSFEYDSIAQKLISMESLDLSCNLFEDLKTLFEFLQNFPKLRFLDLSGNRFHFQGGPKLRVEELNLGATLVSTEMLQPVISCFPELKSLSLNSNGLSDIPEFTVNSLNLANNEFTDIVTGANRLIMSGNRISKIENEVQIESLSLLDQRTPFFLSLESISRLCCQELWLTEAEDEQQRAIIIGLLGDLVKLNGTSITATERRDCELYVLSRAHEHLLPKDRLEKLVTKYGEPSKPQNSSTAINSRVVKIFIDDEEHSVLKSASIQRLLAIVARKKRTTPSKLRLFHGAIALHGEDRVQDCLKGGEHLHLETS